MSGLVIVLVGLLPASRVKNWLLSRFPGYRVAPSARVGPVLLVHVGALEIADDAVIGPFNVFRDLRGLVLGTSSLIGQWNWVSAARPLLVEEHQGWLRIGAESSVTSRHYIDASGGVTIGDFTTMAGMRSTVVTHGIDWRDSAQTARPVSIGDYCLISSNVKIAPGTTVADRIVVGMGATISGTLDESDALYVQSRAVVVKRGLTGLYFGRARGFVHPRGSGTGDG